MTHTPGPWKLNKDKTTVYCTTRNNDEPGICSTKGEALILLSREAQEANARLIASAPDLLEALRELEPIAHRLGGESPKYDLLNNATAKARAAIATAEGRTKP